MNGIKIKIEKIINDYRTNNPTKNISWLGWGTPSQQDIESITDYVLSCHIGSDTTESVYVWDNSNANEVTTTIIGKVAGHNLHAIIISGKTKHVLGGVCVVDLVDELDDGIMG